MTENSAGREMWGKWTVANEVPGLGVCVASLGRDTEDRPYFVVSSEVVRVDQLEAMAHLIAASPELYSALKECADELEGIIRANHGLEAGQDGGKRFERDMTLVRAARSALLRARGESPEVRP